MKLHRLQVFISRIKTLSTFWDSVELVLVVPEAGQVEECDSVDGEGGGEEAGAGLLREELLDVRGEGVHQPLNLDQVQRSKVAGKGG
jgi:hypothetical protein